MKKQDALDTLIIGGGMITNDLILPSVYHLQRLGSVAQIKVFHVVNGDASTGTSAHARNGDIIS